MNPSSPALEAAFYVIDNLRDRYGKKWLGSRHPGVERPSEIIRENLWRTPLKLLGTYQLKGVRQDAHQGLLGWLEGRYPLELFYEIPSPREMLKCQCQGHRIVSLVPTPPPGIEKPYGRHAGPLEFLLHDLEHGQKYFGDPVIARGQQVFFRHLQRTLSVWNSLCTEFQPFIHDLNYLMSDMNSHPVHLMKYMKAIALQAFIGLGKLHEFDVFFESLFLSWGFRGPALESAQRLNYPGKETAIDQQVVCDFFLRSSL